MSRFRKLIRTLWNYLREATGENDYARYRNRARRQHDLLMTPQQFYLWQLTKKYSGIHRCC